jgi:hypothetical protein
VPPGHCDEVVCTNDILLPDCPAGTLLVRDAVDCCGYICEPTECVATGGASGTFAPERACATHADCPEYFVCSNGLCSQDGTAICPPDYVWEEAFPYCGQCVWVGNGNPCLSDDDCAELEYCAFDSVTCGASDRPSDPSTPGAPAVCYGVCRPESQVCEPSSGTTLPWCDGFWSVSYDAAGCPYPICVCADGTTSLDGICRDLCANVDCVAVAPPSCDPGFHAEYLYPYCCGACVPDDICAYYAVGGGSGSATAPTYACPEVTCSYGFFTEIDPATCCPTCVPAVPDGCISSSDCPYGSFCSTELGDCSTPPGCEPNAGASCLDVCYGECLQSDPTRSDCLDSDGGIVPEVAGELTTTAAGTAGSGADTCSQDGTAVIELYCYNGPDGRYAAETYVVCPADPATGVGLCREGACL